MLYTNYRGLIIFLSPCFLRKLCCVDKESLTLKSSRYFFLGAHGFLFALRVLRSGHRRAKAGVGIQLLWALPGVRRGLTPPTRLLSWSFRRVSPPVNLLAPNLWFQGCGDRSLPPGPGGRRCARRPRATTLPHTGCCGGRVHPTCRS